MPIKNFEITNYKCFKSKQVFPSPKIVNLVIGKNNSGKTSFLNIFEYIYSNHNVDFSLPINPLMHYVTDANDIKSIIVTDRYSYDFSGRYAKVDVSNCTNTVIKASVVRNNDKVTVNVKTEGIFNDKYSFERYNVDTNELNKSIKNSINGYEIVKVAAERDISSEAKDYKVTVDKNGKNFTCVLEKIKNHAKSKRQLLHNILESLNKILEGDNNFESIEILENDDGKYTIHLGDKYNEIPITEMGSGLKTLLLVLYHLEVAKEEKKPTIFMFEELENNLHPEIQRRLFNLQLRIK